MSNAPNSAAAGRSMLTLRTLLTDMRAYVKRKTRKANKVTVCIRGI